MGQSNQLVQQGQFDPVIIKSQICRFEVEMKVVELTGDPGGPAGPTLPGFPYTKSVA